MALQLTQDEETLLKQLEAEYESQARTLKENVDHQREVQAKLAVEQLKRSRQVSVLENDLTALAPLVLVSSRSSAPHHV
jgi:hypothetical protein